MKQETKGESLYLSVFDDFERIERDNNYYSKDEMCVNENVFEEMNFKSNIRDSIYRMNCFFENWNTSEKEKKIKLEIDTKESQVLPSENSLPIPFHQMKQEEATNLTKDRYHTSTLEEVRDSNFSVNQKDQLTKFVNEFKKRKNNKFNIGQIIEIVNHWINLSKSYLKSIPNHQMLEAKDKAAKELGIKKKSLDDLLTKLRLGIALNYDYQNHKKDKFVNLRKFIEKNKNNVKWKSSIHEDVDILVSN